MEGNVSFRPDIFFFFFFFPVASITPPPQKKGWNRASHYTPSYGIVSSSLEIIESWHMSGRGGFGNVVKREIQIQVYTVEPPRKIIMFFFLFWGGGGVGSLTIYSGYVFPLHTGWKAVDCVLLYRKGSRWYFNEYFAWLYYKFKKKIVGKKLNISSMAINLPIFVDI